MNLKLLAVSFCMTFLPFLAAQPGLVSQLQPQPALFKFLPWQPEISATDDCSHFCVKSEGVKARNALLQFTEKSQKSESFLMLSFSLQFTLIHCRQHWVFYSSLLKPLLLGTQPFTHSFTFPCIMVEILEYQDIFALCLFTSKIKISLDRVLNSVWTVL